MRCIFMAAGKDLPWGDNPIRDRLHQRAKEVFDLTWEPFLDAIAKVNDTILPGPYFDNLLIQSTSI